MTAALTLNYLRPELTINCVKSLLSDGFSPILIWDNSSDGGKNACKLRTEFINNQSVYIVESPLNLGFAKGVNQGLAWLNNFGVTGPILLINNDAILKKGSRSALVKALASDESLVLVAPIIEQEGAISGLMYYHRWFGLVMQKPFLGSIPYLSGCCLLIDCNALGVHLFDESFFMYGEDVELSFRIISNDKRLLVVPSAHVCHLGSAASGQGTHFYEEMLVFSHWQLASKLSNNNIQAVLFKLLRIISLLMRALVRSIRFRNLYPIFALQSIRKNINSTNSGS